MNSYTRFCSSPAVTQADLDAFMDSDADPLAKVLAAALFSKSEPAKPGEPTFGEAGTFGGGVQIVSKRQVRG